MLLPLGIPSADPTVGKVVRLADGLTPLNGRVEAKVGKLWSAIEPAGGSEAAVAAVICRQLGASNGALSWSYVDDVNSRPVGLTGVQCTGKERSLDACAFSTTPEDVYNLFYVVCKGGRCWGQGRC